MIKPILQFPNPILETCCELWYFSSPSKKLLKQIIKDLKDTLRTEGGLGLSANQIGYPYKIVLASLSTGDTILINPFIVRSGRPLFMQEGCLSDRERGFEEVLRPTAIKVLYKSLINVKHVGYYEHRDAQIIQHEMDHLNGKRPLGPILP